MSFRQASEVRAVGPGVWEAELDASWLQGPSIYGGLSGAALLRAMAGELLARSAGERRLRSFSAQFAAPVAPGRARIEVTVERVGSAASFASARIVQGEGTRVHAMAAFAADRSPDFDEDREVAPEAPPVDSLPKMSWGPPMPVFLQHFDMRLFAGVPYTGAERSGVRSWLVPEEPVDEALLLGLLDVLPPAILTRARELRPMSSMTWDAHVLEVPPSEPGQAWLVDVTSHRTAGGYSDQTSRLFAPGGRLAAYGRQVVAVVR